MPRQKKRLGIFAFAAQLERAEVLVPRSIRYLRFRLHPNPQLVEVSKTYIYFGHACVPPSDRELRREGETRFRSAALFTEHKTPQLIAEMFHLFRVAGCTKALGKVVERLLFLFLRLNPLCDQVNQNAVIAQTPLSRDEADLLIDFGRKSDAAPNRLCRCSFCHCHSITIHHFGADGSALRSCRTLMPSPEPAPNRRSGRRRPQLPQIDGW